jgi:radical SAM superfamily enzyme YgiQ (UPF0313 family)
MFKVQLAQVNYRYGSNAYFPYSVGLLQSYALSHPDIKSKVEFCTPLFLRKPIKEVVDQLEGVQLLGLSSYIWNWNYNLELAKKAKSKFPKLKVVLGGPQVPLNNDDFLVEHHYVDFLIDQEGEESFKQLLLQLTSTKPDLFQVSGLRFLDNGNQIVNSKGEKLENLDDIPSPYTSGMFDRLIDEHPDIIFQATQETHRGCPYSCTFCDWGSATMSKVRRFGQDRLAGEFEWFGSKGIELLYNADANYGLFAEDVSLTEKMIEVKRKTGYPKKFRAAYAKNSNERVFEIAKLLEDEEMCKGITLSFQSMDFNVLDLIKRRNMKVNNFKELITTYRQAHIPTYTELIIGLPGETYETFVAGVDLLLTSGQHDSLSIYHAMLLENAEMNQPAYKETHGIKSQRIPMLFLHGSLEEDDLTEYYEIVTATKTMPTNDWVKTSIFAWGIQAFHCLNLTQSISVGLKEKYGVAYGEFYEGLFDYLIKSDSYLGVLFKKLESIAIEVSHGKGSLDFEVRTFGDIMWPVEEILFLKAQNEDLWPVLRSFLDFKFPNISTADLDDLIKYQRITLRVCDPENFKEVNLSSNWHTFITLALENRLIELERKPIRVSRTRFEKFDNEVDYAREVVWYGRKGSSLREKNLELEIL